MITDFDVEVETEHTIPIWKIGISIFLLIIVLTVSSVLICFINTECRSNITLNTEPFVNALLSLHLFVSFAINVTSAERAYIACRVQMVASFLVYVFVVIALFVFPFTTNWDIIWIEMMVINSVCVWMLSVLWCLYKYYKYKHTMKRALTHFQFVLMILFDLSAVGYIISHFYKYALEPVFKTVCAGLVLLFLGLSIIHIYEIKIKILTR